MNSRFIIEMAQCGYDAVAPKNREEKHLIAVAHSMWESQQLRIREVEAKIARYISAQMEL